MTHIPERTPTRNQPHNERLQVIASGHMVSPSLFWSLVLGTFYKEDHREKLAHKMIVACLTSVRQRPEDYHNFLMINDIKVPRPLRHLFAKNNPKRGGHAHGHKKTGSARKPLNTHNSTLNLLKNNVERLDHDQGNGGGVTRETLASSVHGNGAGGGESRWGAMSIADSDLSDDMSDSVSLLSFVSKETTRYQNY